MRSQTGVGWAGRQMGSFKHPVSIKAALPGPVAFLNGFQPLETPTSIQATVYSIVIVPSTQDLGLGVTDYGHPSFL